MDFGDHILRGIIMHSNCPEMYTLIRFYKLRRGMYINK